MCGTGIMTPLYITVYGLNVRELPVEDIPSGIFVLEVPGLSYENNLDARVLESGYVVFTRSSIHNHGEQSVSAKSFQHYREKLLLPYISVGIFRVKSSLGS